MSAETQAEERSSAPERLKLEVARAQIEPESDWVYAAGSVRGRAYDGLWYV